MAGFSGTVLKGRYGDETPYVEAMAREYQNIDLNLIRTGHRSLFDGVEMFFAAANMPFRNAFNRPWIEAILQKARAQGVQVLLTGAQGNLTISRNGAGLIPMLIRGGQWGQALREARAGENGQFLRTLAGQGIFPLLPSPLYRLGQWLRGSRVPLWGPPWSAYSAINPAFARSQRVAERARTKGGDFLFRQHPDMRLTCARMLPGLTMGANDVYHAYLGLHGVEVRDPTADSRIVEFCLSLPEDQYRRDGVSRRLIRRAMTGRLPAEILANRQRGLQAADWFDRLLASRHALLSELAEWSHDDLVSAVLDLKRLVTLVEQLPRAQGDGARIPTDYRLPLEFGLMTGLFIRWCTTGASGNA
jgi:asparagine synthase (glutamine-hydrolysing)